MSKNLFKIFPIFDHLYIFQVLEYQWRPFLLWFFKHPFARNLQKKHRLQLTRKALSLLTFIVLFQLGLLILSWFLWRNFLLTLILLVVFQFLNPLFYILSSIFYLPVEKYLKNKIITAMARKLNLLPDLKVIAITGSYGKTSTKDILYTLLKKNYRVVKTSKSFNTTLGIAQTILEDIKDNTEIFLVEIGAYQKGEIENIAKIIKPKIGVITAIGPQHLERFGSLENIAKAKFELIESLPQDGLAALNSTSKYLQDLAEKSPCSVIYFGPNYPFFVDNIKVDGEGTSFALHTPQGKTNLLIPLIGKHHPQNFLAAATVAISLGLSLEEIRERATWLLPTPHRLEIKKQGNLTIIDNSYNTNPASSQASLKLLKDLAGEQKILITPGLVELGNNSFTENKLFAQRGAEVADLIIIVGAQAKLALLEGLRVAKYPKEKILEAGTLNEALNKLSGVAKPKAVVLLENDLPDQYS